MIGTIKTKIWQKTDRIKNDGTGTLYLEIYQNTKIQRKRLNLNLAVPINCFDKKSQRVKSRHILSSDYNLIIEKMLSDVNIIEVNYRLNNEILTISKLVEGLTNPNLRISFYSFYKNLLNYQNKKGIIQPETYKQQTIYTQKNKGIQKYIAL